MSKAKPTISDDVLSQIKKGEVKMRSSVYFTLLSVGMALSVITTSAALAYSSSVIYFWVRVMSSNTRAYGAQRNLADSIESFPWWTILVIATLIVSLVILIRKYGSVYRHKTRSIILVIAILSLIGGTAMSLLISNNRIEQKSQSMHQNGSWRNR